MTGLLHIKRRLIIAANDTTRWVRMVPGATAHRIGRRIGDVQFALCGERLGMHVVWVSALPPNENECSKCAAKRAP